MALKQTFEFEVNGVEKATQNVVALSGAIDNLNDEIKDTGKVSEKTAAELDDITNLQRAESIKRVTEGLAGGITSVAASLRGLGVESEALNQLEERANQFVQAVDGAVKVVAVFDKENVKAFKSAVDGFKKSGIAARLFGTTTRAAITATGVGALVILISTLIANWDKVKAASVRAFSEIQKRIAIIAPPLALVVNSVKTFSDRVGGLRQLFRGVAKAAQAFFQNVGESFTALVKGDFGRLREVIKEFGKESSEAFNEGVAEVNEKIAEETAQALTEAQIKANKRRAAELKAAGRESFSLQKQILLDELSLLTQGTDEFNDKQSEIRQLELSNQKAFGDAKRAEAEKQRQADEAEAAAELARVTAENEKAVELEKRKDEALFELEQLRLQNQINAFEQLETLTVEQAQQRAELLTQLRENELEQALENTKLIESERLLLTEQFTTDLIAIKLNEAEQIAEIEARTTESIKAENAKRDEADKEAAANKKALTDFEIQLDNQRIQALSEGVDAAIALVGEETNAGKAFAKVKSLISLADIAINLQRELSSNAAAAAANPLNAVTAGAAGATQLAVTNALAVIRSITGAAAITAQLTKFKDGGLLNGPAHSAGGIRGTGRFSNVEVEGGEFIVNKKATARFLPTLQKINRFADGGQLTDFGSVNAAINSGNPADAVLQTLDNLANREIVVSVEEINRVGANLTRVKETARI